MTRPPHWAKIGCFTVGYQWLGVKSPILLDPNTCQEPLAYLAKTVTQETLLSPASTFVTSSGVVIPLGPRSFFQGLWVLDLLPCWLHVFCFCPFCWSFMMFHTLSFLLSVGSEPLYVFCLCSFDRLFVGSTIQVFELDEPPDLPEESIP